MNTEKCERCGHKWIPRLEDPKMCPRCKSYDWKKKFKLKDKEEK